MPQYMQILNTIAQRWIPQRRIMTSLPSRRATLNLNLKSKILIFTTILTSIPTLETTFQALQTMEIWKILSMDRLAEMLPPNHANSKAP